MSVYVITPLECTDDDSTAPAIESVKCESSLQLQCQECECRFDDIAQLTVHVQQNHVVKRIVSKCKSERKPKSSAKMASCSSTATSQSVTRRPVSLVYTCSKCDSEMSSAQFNETGMCSSCLVKMQLEVICEESSLMMTCESFCAASDGTEQGTDNILSEVFDGNDVQLLDSSQPTDNDTGIENVELQDLTADSLFEMSNITEAYVKIGMDKNVRYRCLLCSTELVRAKSMMKHMLTHVEAENKCELCHEQFEQIDQLQEHLLSKHSQDAVDDINKPDDILTSSQQQFEGEGSSDYAESSDGSRYGCGQCGKQYRHRASLFRHVETHVENLRFDCAECGKTYHHRADFQQHMRLKHLLKNRCVCRYCDRQFYLPGSLRAHLHTHRTEKSYKCRLCDKVYQRSDSLNNHMLMHTGESPYMCTQCGEQFKHRLSMYRHLDSHKDRELFRCELCSRCFKHSNALKEHTKRFHGDGLIMMTQIGMSNAE